MVTRGRPRGNGGQLATYLLTQGENENVQVFEIRGTANQNDLRQSLLEMSLTSELTKSDKGLYHAQINPAYGEDQIMTRENWTRAADILETELGLEGQKRVVVLHEKKGRVHAHVVWERYNQETEKMISDSYSRRAQDRARKIMEEEFQQQKTPERNKKQPVMKKDLTALSHQFPDPIRFIKASKARGYVLASGTQRPYIVVDETGRSFDLVRQLEGVKTREVRERFKETKLPTEKKAIVIAREAQKQKVAKATEVNKKADLLKTVEIKVPQKAVKPEVIDKTANDNIKRTEAEKPKPKPVISWSMKASFVQKSTDLELAQEKLKEVLTREDEEKQKREKLIEEMKRRRELAAKFRDNEQEMF